MLTLTEQAKAYILEKFSGKFSGPKFSGEYLIRLDISPRGCGAAVVRLYPDSAAEDDRQLEADGISFLMQASVYDTVQTVLLDVVNGRFSVRMGVPLIVDGCGNCPASPLQGGTCGIIEGKNF